MDDIEHALLRCSKIKPGADFLLETLKSEIPDFTLERIKYLDFRSEDLNEEPQKLFAVRKVSDMRS